MTTTHKTTIEDLYRVRGKAELVDGEIIQMPPTGYLPGFAASRILYSLITLEQATKSGNAIGDNVGFRVNLPNRQSFSPDAAVKGQRLCRLEMILSPVLDHTGSVLLDFASVMGLLSRVVMS